MRLPRDICIPFLFPAVASFAEMNESLRHNIASEQDMPADNRKRALKSHEPKPAPAKVIETADVSAKRVISPLLNFETLMPVVSEIFGVK